MRGLDRWQRLGLGLVLMSLMSGCGGEGAQVAGTPDETLNLQSFAEDYRMYSISKKQPPRKMDDMKVLQTMASPAMAEVRNGNILVEWGAALPDTKEEPGQSPAPEILAYGKEVPEKGGYVLHLDRTVSRVTAEEFKAAPKAAGSADKKP
ncbi:hypothetical protein SAMN05444166_6713 [Singulisphaera sp. GP187]|uniref:hypothetical protein n=1 Tax=Singulisphaera sp. GP187 TaxID=1882752 RepID=UPI00092ABF20|nr:hypothetical protein [Singulisphaera sp. GP187]SIO61297.1 hypothetical protein SAMN05444166_6713 [Singulisphaera sp. GP187]